MLTSFYLPLIFDANIDSFSGCERRRDKLKLNAGGFDGLLKDGWIVPQPAIAVILKFREGLSGD
ncbi:MAG: hypothetical protein KME04_14925 [Pleurocapsa minor GSE-CHR-MK-17-07R]|jgi:hypothetical protein|nr:hypothetical protein [Pleurocapsa minor GSE-CHR-MK 17-07R]